MALASLCAHPDQLCGQTLAQIEAPDLLQLLLDQLIASGNLDQRTISLFAGHCVYSLVVDDLPQLQPSWLKPLQAAPLRVVELAHCRGVSPCSWHRWS